MAAFLSALRVATDDASDARALVRRRTAVATAYAHRGSNSIGLELSA